MHKARVPGYLFLSGSAKMTELGNESQVRGSAAQPLSNLFASSPGKCMYVMYVLLKLYEFPRAHHAEPAPLSSWRMNLT